ncbi:M23 family metallopeptidase [Caulobacter mirabilis]|uniref:Peptidase M24 n=1 Tax=Caulobacter mirabilis TaxID=69666 RepID=A0A2D2AV13_9CAUL|nr:peptidoglycan DD-metalloendopeptidase family protein [Caulobacter mirabilis]ATQ41825.1 peptidase M24 [Caulobacter mirabilis]
MQEFDPRRPTLRFAPKILVAVAGLSALGLCWKLTAGPEASASKPLDQVQLAALQHAAFAQAEAQPGFDRGENVNVEVRPGETLTAAVARSGVGDAEARNVVGVLSQAMDTVNIKAGMDFVASVAQPRDGHGQARLIGLSMRTDAAKTITVSRTFDGALRLREMEEKVREETTVACGKMDGSFHESASAVGADSGIVAQASKLFAHKIDFSRDIKAGDPFCLVFDRKITESGRTIEAGDLQYAEIKGQRFYGFTNAQGKQTFLDSVGKTVKSMFLRTPVDGARITSKFGVRRHPILGYNKMHQGIDFGAGTGTPVLASGDGVVVEARRWGGYGNWVRIRHADGWETGYAHLSRYAKGLRPGQRVSQGQVIAYVGSTGASTGPHLHYEIWRKGQRVNPMGAKIAVGTSQDPRDIAAFKAAKTRLDALVAPKRILVGAPAPVEATEPGDGKKLIKSDFDANRPALKPRAG